MIMAVGYAQRVVTPSLARGVFLAGFGANRRAESVHDDLFARALAVGDGVTQVVVVAVDVIGLARPFCQAVEAQVRAARPGVHLLVAATHTHHGPDTLGLWGPEASISGVDDLYMAALAQAIVACALEAVDAQQPADLRAANALATGVAKNARDPDVKDEVLTCLQFCAAPGGQPLATLLIYPCHPEVLWETNLHLTSDFCASLRTTVEAATGAPALALVGALGGMMTPDMGAHTFEAAAAMGAILGTAALAALAAAPSWSVTRLRYLRHPFAVPLENPLFRQALTAGLLAGELNDDGTLTTEASLLQIGGAWLVGVPGELLPRLGLAYRAQMARAGAMVPAIVGLANDELGYILPADEFVYPDDPSNPGAHYEESMSAGIDAGPRLTAAVAALIQAMQQTDRDQGAMQ